MFNLKVLLYFLYMTLWHQRLIIFLSKILAVMIGIILLILVLYYNFYFKKDNLIKYVPQRAILYQTMHLDKELLRIPLAQKLQQELALPINLNDLDLSILNPLANYNFSWALIPDQQADWQYDYLLIFNLKETNGRLQPYSQIIDQIHWHQAIITNQVLDRKILAVSNSEKLIGEIQEISRQEKPALADNIDVVLNLAKFKIGYLGNLYFDFSYFTKNLNKVTDSRIKLFLSSSAGNSLKEIFAGIKLNGDRLVLETNESSQTQDKQTLLIENVPADFMVNFCFEDLSANLNKILQNLSSVNPAANMQITKNREYLEGLVNFSFNQDIAPFLSNQGQLIITKGNKYILALKVDKLDNLETRLNKIEEIARQYLATTNPKEKMKLLPDKTYITQVVKDIDDWQFFEEQIGQLKLRSIKNGEQEWAYVVREKVLILANSKEILKQLINNNDLVDIGDNYLGNSTNFSQNIVVKGEYLEQFWPIFKVINTIIINDNLGSNNEIRLTLD